MNKTLDRLPDSLRLELRRRERGGWLAKNGVPGADQSGRRRDNAFVYRSCQTEQEATPSPIKDACIERKDVLVPSPPSRRRERQEGRGEESVIDGQSRGGHYL